MWAVERILRAGTWKGQRGMLVKWTGFVEPTWEFRANLTLTDAFKTFVAKYGEGDDVGEDGIGAYTGSKGKIRKLRKKRIKKKNTPLANSLHQYPREGR